MLGIRIIRASLVGSQESACNAGDTGSTPGSGRFPRDGHGCPGSGRAPGDGHGCLLQCSSQLGGKEQIWHKKNFTCDGSLQTLNTENKQRNVAHLKRCRTSFSFANYLEKFPGHRWMVNSCFVFPKILAYWGGLTLTLSKENRSNLGKPSYENHNFIYCLRLAFTPIVQIGLHAEKQQNPNYIFRKGI